MKALFIMLIVCIPFFCCTAFAYATDITAQQGLQKVTQGALLIDVRTPQEFTAGHVEGALNIQHDSIAEQIARFGTDKTREIVLYCRSGRRSGIAKDTLIQHGFTRVFNAGGYQDFQN